MYRRIAGAVVAAAASLLVLGATAAPAAAAPPGTYARSHHASYAECDAAGKAGRHLWGVIYFCEQFPTRPDVYVLWVRY
ncbi:hypothetical protein [Streptomyces genisteinicus]|uniref:Secreted protein n=1 Tax=Streptomyces genisteinicus TaxID=2768068 RepID=A0A7H0HY24_9ACTN|nr:hypothetical protein [Streptomyces genisteinicus]QNP65440.1 hypothetical protein IAG43_22595 [Streptomyces genisteinicus]